LYPSGIWSTLSSIRYSSCGVACSHVAIREYVHRHTHHTCLHYMLQATSVSFAVGSPTGWEYNMLSCSGIPY
jgi:hypothetical protein